MSSAEPTSTEQPTDPAATLLEQALRAVTGARRASYGKPEENFACIAMLRDDYIQRRRAAHPKMEYVLDSTDVAVMMVLVKCARLAETPNHTDSWRDIAGYAACGARASGADLTK